MMCINSLVLQSSDINEETTESSGGGTEISEVLTFVDNSEGCVNSIEYNKNSIATASLSSNTDLQAYLSRPTKIDSRSWFTAGTVGPLGSNIEPWFLFLNNPVIKNKLANYAFLRAKLCIKVVINATPFHHGLCRVSYEPSVGFRTTRIRTGVSDDVLVVPYSQLPGVWLLPADNSGGELHIPFFCHTNFLQLTSASMVKNMGLLRYYIAAPLRVVSSSGNTAIDVDTFAWLEDVELSTSTAELSLQSADEYDTPVAITASAVAKISSYLDKVPVIGKFARATTIGASAIAQIAGMFGFTNVPVIDPVHAIVPVPGIHLSSSELSTPIQKLSLDPKQELSIDPTLHGISNKDEMAIASIVGKKSALGVTYWNTTDGPGSTLFNARVSPMLFQSSSVNISSTKRADRVYPTPLSYLSRMFTHWRGDIIFEFQVICTKFHKGRLKICWDPLGKSGTSSLPENTVYTAILDVGENNKATFRVPYHQMKSFLRCRRSNNPNYTYGTTLSSDHDYDNGMLIVSVFTTLVAPTTPSSVGILVSIYGADNFEFANPCQNIGIGETAGDFRSPSFFAVQSKDSVDIESQAVKFGDNGSKHPNRYDLNFGQRIVSTRALLHRHSIYDTNMSTLTTGALVSFVKSYSRLPPSYGYDPDGKGTANKADGTTTTPFNWSPMHPIAYISNMYGAYRGSVNYVANIAQDIFPSIGDIRVQRLTTNNLPANRVLRVDGSVPHLSTANELNAFINSDNPYYFGSGGAIINTITNGAVSWNAPMQNNNNFEYTDPRSANNGNTHDGTRYDCTLLNMFIKQLSTTENSKGISVTSYAGTGPDFTCLWLLCCPTVDYYTYVPTY